MVKRPKIPPDKVKGILKRLEDGDALTPDERALIREILTDAIRIGLVKGVAADELRGVLKRLEEHDAH